MNANDLSLLIQDLLLEEAQNDAPISRVESYEDAGILTNDEGLVVTIANGRSYQITIKRSK